MNKTIILGASRGLGAELVKTISSRQVPVLGVARKEVLLKKLKDENQQFTYQVADFSKLADQQELIMQLTNPATEKIFYTAGGGPYGLYGKHQWSDHQWALEVCFLFPARLLHALAQKNLQPQVILVGSSVAESDADPNATSYASAKHALKGLFASLRKEYPNWDLRLFSPGYIDTELLPANAAVRKHGVFNPTTLAQDLWTWSLTTDPSGHKLYPKYST